MSCGVSPIYFTVESLSAVPGTVASEPTSDTQGPLRQGSVKKKLERG